MVNRLIIGLFVIGVMFPSHSAIQADSIEITFLPQWGDTASVHGKVYLVNPLRTKLPFTFLQSKLEAGTQASSQRHTG